MPQFTPLNSKEILLLLLSLHSRAPIIGRTRLMNTMFLFAKEVQPSLHTQGIDCTLPEFEANDYGPFAPNVLQDLETLQTLDMLTIETIPMCDPFDLLEDWNAQIDQYGRPGIVDRQSMERYQLTAPRGQGFCDTLLLPQFNSAEIQFLTQFKSLCNEVSLIALIRYVYTRYPHYIRDPQIRDHVLKYDTLPCP